MRPALAALLAALAPGCAADAPLERLLAFKDPQWCAPGADFERLTQSLLVARERGDHIVYMLGELALPRAFRGQAGQARLEEASKDVYLATLPLRGTWHGAPVREVYVWSQPETDNQGLGIRFAAPPEAVRAAANRAGLRLPPSGERVEDSELTLTIAVRPEAGGATLSCGT